jgi:hypothetical protein
MAREELADALQVVFLAEVVAPSEQIWIITPWISDVPIIDNRTGRLDGVWSDVPARWLRLAEVLVHIIHSGGQVTIACRPDDHNLTFVENLRRRCRETGVEDNLEVFKAEDLHEKGILTDDLLLSGSMNLTFNGLRRLEEVIYVHDDRDTIERTRFAYKSRWTPA